MAYFEGQLKRATTDAGEEHTGYVLETEIDMSAIHDICRAPASVVARLSCPSK